MDKKENPESLLPPAPLHRLVLEGGKLATADGRLVARISTTAGADGPRLRQCFNVCAGFHDDDLAELERIGGVSTLVHVAQAAQQAMEKITAALMGADHPAAKSALALIKEYNES